MMKLTGTEPLKYGEVTVGEVFDAAEVESLLIGWDIES